MSNPFIDSLLSNPLLAGLTFWQLAPAIAIVGAVLGYCAYTDLYRGRIIPNAASVGLIVGALAIVPIVVADPARHLIIAGIICVVLTLMTIVGVFAPGDWKLYCGLSILLGPAALVLIFLSFAIIILYSIPIALKTIKSRKLSVEKPKAGHRLGTSPGAPGIALAFPLTLYFIGLEPVYALALTAVIALSFVASRIGAILDEKAGVGEDDPEPSVKDPVVS